MVLLNAILAGLEKTVIQECVITIATEMVFVKTERAIALKASLGNLVIIKHVPMNASGMVIVRTEHVYVRMATLEMIAQKVFYHMEPYYQMEQLFVKLAGLEIVVKKETALEDVNMENVKMVYVTAIMDSLEIIVI